jgi:hypothetical protein
LIDGLITTQLEENAIMKKLWCNISLALAQPDPRELATLGEGFAI